MATAKKVNKSKKPVKEKDNKKKKKVIPFWWWIIGGLILIGGGTVGGLAAGGVFNSNANNNTGHSHWYQYTEVEKWWEHCSNGGAEAATEDDIGKTVKVTLNGTEHEVRLIGVDHLEPGETSTQAHCTFEFVNLISDENGCSLATYWQDTDNNNNDANHNYLDSSIRSALNGKCDNPNDGSTKPINWFQYFGPSQDIANKHFSTNYSDYSNGERVNNGKSVLDMLPNDLASTIKPVTKKVNVYDNGDNGSYSETDCTDKLFLLSIKEMGYSVSGIETGVTTYKYYKDHTKSIEAVRIKQQVKVTDGSARTSSLSGTDLDGAYASAKYCYAGYNDDDTTKGGRFLLRSPDTQESTYASSVLTNGGHANAPACYYASAVAPAFCI